MSIAVLFEVTPHSEQFNRYLEIAAGLRNELQHIEGFESIERFESLTTKGKILSLSIWRDERAVEEWRRLASHRAAQALGRSEIFITYRLRVAAIVRDYGLNERDQAPRDSRRTHG